ncbi:MAG TPA: hypothetical protein VM283_08070, partial [Armatimonadota bacterium]|nr:hypothetical protein [Armatimonadota bacterium]
MLAERDVLVVPDQIVAQARRDGEIHAVDVAAGLRIIRRDVRRHVLVDEGQWLAAGTILAEKRSFLAPPRAVWAPAGGTIEALRDGRLYIRGDPQLIRRRAHLPGKVLEVFPGRGVAILCTGLLLSGVWGAGGEARGPLRVRASADEAPLVPEGITREERGAILLGGALEDETVLRRARAVGLAGLVVSGLHPDLAPAASACGVPL